MRLIHLAITMTILALLMVAVPSAFATTITVTTTTDENGTGTACSLREAVEAANTDSAYGGCPAGVGADIIELPDDAPDGVYTLSGSDLDIASDITIQPVTGATGIIIQAAGTPNAVNRRVFTVTASGVLALNSLTVQNGGALSLGFLQYGGCINVTDGDLTLNSTIVRDCRTPFEGGAIFAESTTTPSTTSVVIENDSTLTGSIAGDDGGAIRSVNAALSISDSNIFDNQALGGFSDATFGGGIAFEGESLSISGSVITDNIADDADGGSGLGGGIAVRIHPMGMIATITETTISGNRATGTDLTRGGGIYKYGSGSINITDSIIEDNQATSTSGTRQGGGIYITAGPINITGSRLQRNSADDAGGAFYSPITLNPDLITNSCIVDNSDIAVLAADLSPVLDVPDNWWGSSWGPQIPEQTGTGSAVSTGDSINGSGLTPVNVDDATAGINYGTEQTAPSGGNWKLTAPTGCLTCQGVSTNDHTARICT